MLWVTGLLALGIWLWWVSIGITSVALIAAVHNALRYPETGSWRCFMGHRYLVFKADRHWEPWVIAAGRFVRYEVRCYGCGRSRR